MQYIGSIDQNNLKNTDLGKYFFNGSRKLVDQIYLGNSDPPNIISQYTIK